MLKKILSIGIILFFFVACSKPSSINQVFTHDLGKKEGIYSVKQARSIDMKELVKDLEYYPVIFVGDYHDTKKTHKFFENLLKELDKEGYKIHLANEWFSPKHNKLLEEFISGQINGSELKQRRKWDEFTNFKWEYVEPLYEAVKKNNGKLYGMNISKEDRKKIRLKKFDKMSKSEKEFYDSLDLNVSAHKQLVMPFLEHCNKMPQKSDEPCEERMYRVQVAWDSYMAKNLADISKNNIKTKKDKVVVFAGAMHIEQNLGIPLRFSRLSNLPFTTISNEEIDEESDLVKVNNSKSDFVYIYK
mgnify:CR=1 FL=1